MAFVVVVVRDLRRWDHFVWLWPGVYQRMWPVTHARRVLMEDGDGCLLIRLGAIMDGVWGNDTRAQDCPCVLQGNQLGCILGHGL